MPSMATEDRCTCPRPSSCGYCSRMYPCDCAGCPSQTPAEKRAGRGRLDEANRHHEAAAFAARITGCLDEDEV